MAPTVAVLESGADVIESVGAALDAIDWRSAIPAGAEVCLKPNLGWDLFLPGAVTSALVVEGVIRKLQGHVGRLYLVEADQVLVDCERALSQTGMDRLCDEYDVEWVNLSRMPFVNVRVKGPLAIEYLPLPEILTRTLLVTIPVMKTHNKTVLSGAIKNQWGCLPTFRHNYHPIVNEVLRDLTSVLTPALSVLDATVALEGNGPKSGRPRVCNLVLAGRDPVAVDTVSARIMGLERFRLRHLELCAAAGIGQDQFDAISLVGPGGEPLGSLPRFEFETAEHNLVSWVETALRRTGARRLVFETGLLSPFCWGARLWYLIWYYLGVGRWRRNKVIRESPYGWQWTNRASRD